MIRELEYLWTKRERPASLSRFLLVWAKRTWHGPGLLRFLLSPIKYRMRGATIGRFVVMPGARVLGRAARLTVGDESSLGRCQIHLHGAVRIGKRVAINDGVVLLTASHAVDDPSWALKIAPIVIGDYAWIAMNAIILPGVSIGEGAVVGAGAVVTKDVAASTVVVGSPATEVKNCRASRLNYSPVLMNAPIEAWTGRAYVSERNREAYK